MSKKVYGAFTVRWAPQDGKDGKDGADGKQGCSIRTTEWQAGFEYHNDSNTTIVPPIIDCVVITASDGTFTLWQCKQTHVSSASNKPSGSGNSYWVKMNQTTPIYTPLIMADNAVFRVAQSNKIVVEGDAFTTTLTSGTLKMEAKNTKAYITMGIDENEYPQLRFVNPDGTTQFFIGFNGLAYGFKTPKLLSVRSQYRTSLNTKINQYETNYTLTLGIKNVDETRSLDSGYFTAECQTLNDSNLVIYDTMEQSVETPIEPGATSFVVFTYLLLTAEQPTSLPLPPQYRVKFVGDMFTNGEFSV